MKCPACGRADMVRETRDVVYKTAAKTVVIPAVTAGICPACGESICDEAESARVIDVMLAANSTLH